MRIAMCILISFFAVSCSFHRDVSRLKPFSDYTGREVTLVTPACLVEEWYGPNGEALVFHLNPDKTYSGAFMSRSKRTPADTVLRNADYGNGHVFLTPQEAVTDYEKRYTLWDEGDNGCGLGILEYWGDKVMGTQTAKFWTIPAGTKLWIDQVNVEGNTFAGSYTSARGRVYLEDEKKEVVFDYSWAAGFNLQRAPWEDDTVPAKRFIGRKGDQYSESFLP